ncbi:MAG: tetratricopeptide repeat protein [Chitinophagales bacterium]|nr:tetratricopeptide repeat protein [Chitinophagales bacterium]
MFSNKNVSILSIIAILLIGVLYFGNFTKKNALPVDNHQHESKTVSIDDYEQGQTNTLSEEDKAEINILKSNLSKAKGVDQKIDFFHKIAHFWKGKSDVISNYYLFRSAKHEGKYDSWMSVGDQFMTLLRNSDNQEIREISANFAMQSYEAALKINPDDNDLKLKAGSAYIESGTEPMKGVSLIKEVTQSDPNNQEALILLARFSIMSGQFDKAKQHLDKVLEMNPVNTEAIFFMAITQAELGNSDKAIELLEVSKKMVNNPDYDAEIDVYINDLKSHKK